ncbi:MAG: hypothetical protein JO366_07165 [Methylobacteriaceae bacterium]|nr:hypothetical protein [Methylobacteriaceae bacterium]
MKHNSRLSILVLSLLFSPSAVAPAQAETCSRRMGPYLTNDAAAAAAQEIQGAGYETSGIWGEGGIVSDWSNRRYFFTIFFAC